MQFLNGCTALITGASAGIGQEFARQLAPLAECLVLVARREERLEELKRELMAEHPRLDIRICGHDLADTGQVTQFLAWLTESGLKIDFLINNAGVGDYGLFEESDWTRIKRIIDVNIQALTRLTHALIPTLLAHPQAAILNVSSVAALLPVPNLAVYAASKAYVSSFTEAIRLELRGTGVSVTALCPGPVDTEFHRVANRKESGQTDAPESLKVRSTQVVRQALDGVMRDRARVIPGAVVAVLMIIVSLIPIFVLRSFLPRPRHMAR